MKLKILFLTVLISFTATLHSFAKDPVRNSPEDLIARLYREYQPENVNKLDEEQRLHSGLRFDKPQTLSRYFDENLMRLFVRDAECTKRAQRVCNLDFEPVIDAQDFDERTPLDLKMEQVSKRPLKYKVSFNNFGRRSLLYVLRQTKNGWRISDIIYPSGHSLKKILSRKLEW